MHPRTVAMKKVNGKQKIESVGPNIVRAWFDTVINPILEALEMERGLLRKKNWTWQFRPGGLESMRHLRGYIALEARPNLELFERLNPGVASILKAHDTGVDKLARACAELQTVLQTNSRLRDLYSKFTSPKSLETINRTVADLFGGYRQSDHIALLAQFIVNNAAELPDYYYTAPFWNRHRTAFLAFLRSPSLKSRSDAVNTAGAELLRQVETLIILLGRLRLSLALEYDLPPGSEPARHSEAGR